MESDIFEKKNLDFIDPDEGRAPGINPAMSQQGGWRVGGGGFRMTSALRIRKGQAQVTTMMRMWLRFDVRQQGAQAEKSNVEISPPFFDS